MKYVWILIVLSYLHILMITLLVLQLNYVCHRLPVLPLHGKQVIKNQIRTK
jgi:hypothetical protein